MPNQLNFDVQFNRKDIQAILDAPEAQFIYVAGTYNFDPASGPTSWEMEAVAVGCDASGATFGSPASGCIRPCP